LRNAAQRPAELKRETFYETVKLAGKICKALDIPDIKK
jgi:hypothetical protein